MYDIGRPTEHHPMREHALLHVLCTNSRVNMSSHNTSGVVPAGLWLFSRKPVDPEKTTLMRDQAKKLGYDLSVLKKVEQQGCTYPSTTGGSNGGSSGSSGGGQGEKGGSSQSG